MMTNSRRGLFTVIAVAVGLLVACGVAGASALGAGPLAAVGDTTTTVDAATTTGDPSTTADTATTIDPTSTTVDGSTTTEATTTLVAAPTTVDPGVTTTVPDRRGPDPTGPAGYGLCRAFADRVGQPGHSQAWARLNEQAGGDIQGWCAVVLADKAARRGHGDGGVPPTTVPQRSTSVPTAAPVPGDPGHGPGPSQAAGHGKAGGTGKGNGKG